jgi:hypothetical protein
MNKKELGKRIKEQREKVTRDKNKFYNELGYNNSANNIEYNGSISVPNLYKVADKLDISVDYLVGLKKSKKRSEPKHESLKDYLFKVTINYNAGETIQGKQTAEQVVEKINKKCSTSYTVDNIIRWKAGHVPSIGRFIEVCQGVGCRLDDFKY